MSHPDKAARGERREPSFADHPDWDGPSPARPAGSVSGRGGTGGGFEPMTPERASIPARGTAVAPASRADPVPALAAALEAHSDGLTKLLEAERERFAERLGLEGERIAAALEAGARKAASGALKAGPAGRLEKAVRRARVSVAVFTLCNWLAVAALYLVLR